MAIEKEYIVRVQRDHDMSMDFRYHIELVDPESNLAVAHDWCSFRFSINRTVKKLLKKQFRNDNTNLVREFRAKARMK